MDIFINFLIKIIYKQTKNILGFLYTFFSKNFYENTKKAL